MAKRTRKWYGLALAAAAGLLIAYAHTRGLYDRYSAYQASENEVRELEQRLRQLKREEEALARRVHGLEHDPLEIEANLRETKNLVRPGERIYRIIE